MGTRGTRRGTRKKLKMSEVSVVSNYVFKSFKIQDPDNAREIKPFQNELEKCRLEDIKTVMESVGQIRSDFESLKTDVSNLRENRTDYLRQKIYDIEGKITHFKEVIKEELLALLKNEINLSKDLNLTERRLENWEKPINIKIFKPFKKNNNCKVATDDNNPTTEFQKFLSSSGGHYGGWEEQDHFLFLRERKKYKGNEKFLTVVHSLLPDLSFDVIEEHEKWYNKYEELKKNQREAIQKWKEGKKKEFEKKRKEKEEKKEGEEKKEMKKLVRQQINIAERIKEWKNQQLLRKLEEEERQKKEREKLKEEEKRKKELQERKKLAVSQYKAEKLKKSNELLPKKDEQKLLPIETKTRNNLSLKSFRLQDLKFIERKKIIRFQIESKENERLSKWRMAKPALEFILQRDPQRVFQPTIIWNQHCSETNKREKIDHIFDLNSIPRLAIPEWRRELK